MTSFSSGGEGHIGPSGAQENARYERPMSGRDSAPFMSYMKYQMSILEQTRSLRIPRT